MYTEDAGREPSDPEKAACRDALGDLSSLSSLSSVCSQPIRSKEGEAPWGSIVPVHGLTLCSPEAKPVDQMQPSTSLPPERVRPHTPPLPHSVSTGMPCGTARLEVISDALAEPSGSTCSPEADASRARLRSAHEMARDTRKDSRRVSGQRLVSKAWLQDNFAALDLMQGALTKSMELRSTSALERCCSRSCVSSRASPVPTVCTDMSAATSAEVRGLEVSVTPSPRYSPRKPGRRNASQQASPSSPCVTPGSHCKPGNDRHRGALIGAAGNQRHASMGADRYGPASPGSSTGTSSAAAAALQCIPARKADASVLSACARPTVRADPANPLRKSLNYTQQRSAQMSTQGRRTLLKGGACSMPAAPSRAGFCSNVKRPGKEPTSFKVCQKLSAQLLWQLWPHTELASDVRPAARRLCVCTSLSAKHDCRCGRNGGARKDRPSRGV